MCKLPERYCVKWMLKIHLKLAMICLNCLDVSPRHDNDQLLWFTKNFPKQSICDSFCTYLTYVFTRLRIIFISWKINHICIRYRTCIASYVQIVWLSWKARKQKTEFKFPAQQQLCSSFIVTQFLIRIYILTSIIIF